jgi:hypothetical protein
MTDGMLPPPTDTGWLETEAIREGPSAGLILGLFFVGLCLLAALAAAVWR